LRWAALALALFCERRVVGFAENVFGNFGGNSLFGRKYIMSYDGISILGHKDGILYTDNYF
jgi:hypothetical protein